MKRARVLCVLCLLGLLGGGTLAAGCRKSGSNTGVVVQVSSDLGVPAQMDQVRVTAVASDGTLLFEQTLPLTGGSAHALPVRVGLLRQGSATAAFRVVAEGLLGQTVAARQSAKLTFIQDRTVLLELVLLAACAGKTCAAGQTCGAGGTCRPEDVDPSGLPTYTPRDGGGAASDGASDVAAEGDRPAQSDGGAADVPKPPDAAPDAATDRPMTTADASDAAGDRAGADRAGDAGPPLPDAGPDAVVNLNAGLVAYWAFDQAIQMGTTRTYADYSGNANTFQLGAGNPTTSPFGGAIDLTPLGGSGSVAESSSITAITTAVTIATWIRPLGPFGSRHALLTRFIYAQPELAVDFSEQGMLRFVIGPRVMQTGAVVGNSEQWVHIAATYDGNRGTLYVGGQVSVSNVLGSVSLMGTNGFSIGARYDINYIPYDELQGELDEFTIYNRALNAAEVAQLANGVFPTRR